MGEVLVHGCALRECSEHSALPWLKQTCWTSEKAWKCVSILLYRFNPVKERYFIPAYISHVLHTLTAAISGLEDLIPLHQHTGGPDFHKDPQILAEVCIQLVIPPFLASLHPPDAEPRWCTQSPLSGFPAGTNFWLYRSVSVRDKGRGSRGCFQQQKGQGP